MRTEIWGQTPNSVVQEFGVCPNSRYRRLFVAYSPDLIPYIIGNEKRSVTIDEYSDRSSPRRAWISAVHNPSGDEVLDRSWLSILEGNKRHSITGKLGAIPGAVQADEQAVTVPLWKLRACVEGYAE